jgi:hypothetical protein
MITWYGDILAPDFNDPNLWNRYLEQQIDSGPTQHFTIHPQIDSAIFKYFGDTHKFKTFADYTTGCNIVIIGLHGGWTPLKLKFIKEWFISDPNRLAAWHDPECRIILDYSEEGFTTELFGHVCNWIEDNQLLDRVLYVSSSCNVAALYKEWCQQEHIYENMQTVWYGFFTNWILRDREMCQNDSVIPQATYTAGNPRWMCLNRRPHPHRIYLLTMLERYRLLETGSVSMPKHFGEKEIDWDDKIWNIQLQWECLKDRFNGHIDALDTDFKSMYNKLPLIADTEDFAFNYALNLNGEYSQNFPINVISETLFFSAATFASEKIWKPMLMGQIFLVMAAPLYLQSLRDLGFKTFSPFINEEYDLCMNPMERATALVRSLQDLIRLSEKEFATLLANCAPILQYNQQLLTNRSSMEHLVSVQVVRSIESLWDF